MTRIKTFNSILSGFRNTVSNEKTKIKASVYKEKYGTVAEELHKYSERVLNMEGIFDEENNPQQENASDIMLAKAIASDVQANGWEGAGQAMNKIYSCITGRNLNGKYGMVTRMELPTITMVKHQSGKVGMITENANLIVPTSNGLDKETSYQKMNTEISVPTLEDCVLFLGETFENAQRTRNFQSSFKIGNLDALSDLIGTSMLGMDTEESDANEYRKYLAGRVNPDFFGGVQAT